jgi:Ssp1 endopeptidase immunity protein Rap1a
MRRVAWAALLLPVLMASAAVAQGSADIRNAKAMLPHCAAGLAPDAQDIAGGRCAGIMATLSFVSRVLPDNLKFCHPSATTPEQMLQVITSFVEANPDAGAQDFRLVALAAMRQKWPCQE